MCYSKWLLDLWMILVTDRKPCWKSCWYLSVSTCITGKAWTLLDILLISIGVTAALVIVVMCVVKWREDIAFTVRHHLSLTRGREMQTFITDEEAMGESTPPPGKTFHYDQLSPSHHASNITSWAALGPHCPRRETHGSISHIWCKKLLCAGGLEALETLSNFRLNEREGFCIRSGIHTVTLS